MKSIWTDGPVRWHRPVRSRMKILWTVWAVGYAMLGLWLLGMATGFFMSWWLHGIGAVALMAAVFCTYYGFKYCEFLEPQFTVRERGEIRDDLKVSNGSDDSTHAP